MAAYPKRTLVPDIDNLPDSALIRLGAILALFSCGRSTWYAWVAAGLAPQPVRVGHRTVAWRLGDLRPMLAGQPNTPLDLNAAKAVAARVAKRAAAKAAEAERARRRALLL